MQARYIQDGNAIDYTSETDIAAGTIVVISGRIGIAKVDIQAGRLGALHVVGVYEVVKGDAEIPLGTTVYWDAVAGKAVAVKTETTPRIGIAVRAANAADTRVRVLLG